MKIVNPQYTLEMDEKTGSILSLHNGKREFIHKGENRPLFALRLRDEQGNAVDLDASQAQKVKLQHGPHGFQYMFYHVGGHDIRININVRCPINEPFSYWKMDVVNQTDMICEYMRFPDIVVPNDLVSQGGDMRLLWPCTEGAVIEDASLRETSQYYPYRPFGYPLTGWLGVYPGNAALQMMAYYGPSGGLYIGTHDIHSHVKTFEYYRHQGGIRLETILATDAAKGFYYMDYEVKLGFFQGDWHDAAEIYRQWFEAAGPYDKAPVLEQNPDLPAWIDQSPLVVAYPVRGTKDTGDMTPNDEYFPLNNALPYLEAIAQKAQSPVMPLLMHWEGTAPWAPPYVWPPFGGEQGFRDFADRLHAKGNLLSVYCSGIGYTLQSAFNDYNKYDEFEQKHLADEMCVLPDGSLPPHSLGTIRDGLDLCPSRPIVKEICTHEAAAIANAGADYIQFFDQNLGGCPYACYSKNHGHPPGPGRWRNPMMTDLFRAIAKAANESAGGRKVLIGCETAATEPFIPFLPFNELRFPTIFQVGIPVPLYQYVFHRYVINFQGNQITSSETIDCRRSPENLPMRAAMAFTFGEMLTVMLRGKGQLNWGWLHPWDDPAPDQEGNLSIIANLNAWRRGLAKPFVMYGQMEKPIAVTCRTNPLHRNDGGVINMPSVLSSRWTSSDGHSAQVLVNYTDQPQAIEMDWLADVQLLTSPMDNNGIQISSVDGKITFTIPEMQAVMVRIS